MKSLINENEVHEMADSPSKRAMENRIRIAHANFGADVVFDVVADCGGNCHLLEEGVFFSLPPVWSGQDEGIAGDISQKHKIRILCMVQTNDPCCENVPICF